MGRSVSSPAVRRKRDAILEALENLTAGELRKFRLKLGSVQPRQGFRNIPRGALGPLDPVDLTDKLVALYCEDYAAELTAAVLLDVGVQEEAARLQRAA
ncbi:pyrin domain-containing protein 1 [Eulemur rufifrons]|uniref:pyrin domain-containing protein 1 n=1 Tax=Eulemur rufifrons TaxID=859984 RepID=UPI00374497CD